MLSFARILACLFTALPGAVWPASEDAPIASKRIIEEIVVIATRRETEAQATPLAITALSTADRDLLGLRSIAQMADFTPGVSYQSKPGQFNIRGIGRLDNALGSDPGVATYYDGAYTAETGPIGQTPLFIERTEILRGPQGTLFGRNSVGGLVNVISRRPSEEFEMDLRTRFSNYDGQFLATSISGPVPGLNELGYRLNISRDEHDGYQKNNGSGRDGESNEGSEYYELQLAWDFSESLSLWLKHSHFTSEALPGIDALIAPYATDVFQGPLIPFAHFGLQNNPALRDNRRVSHDHDGITEFESDRTVVELSYRFTNLQVKYIGSYTEAVLANEIDADGTDQANINYPLPGLAAGPNSSISVSTFATALVEQNTRTASHELQILSAADQRVQYTGGLYYYKEAIEQPFNFRLPLDPALRTPFSFATFGLANANPSGDFYYQLGELDSEAFAGYIQLETEISHNLNLTTGLRYSRDKKDGYEEQRVILYNPALNVSGLLGFVLPVTTSIDVSANSNGPASRLLVNEWGAFSGKVGLDYQVAEELLVYGHITRGYKSGGMRLGQLEGLDLTRADGISQSISPFVEEETVWAYEVGLKSDVFSKTLRLNMNAFYYNYENQQAPLSIRDSNDIVVQDFINVPESRTYGFELESVWFATANLQLVANYGYLDSQVADDFLLVDTDLPIPAQVNVTGNRLPKTPKHKFYLAATYYWDTAIGSISATGSWSHYSDQYTTFFERDLHKIESYAMTNARLAYASPDESFRAVLSVANLTNEDAPVAQLSAAGSNLNFARIERPGTPRIVSLELTKTFGARQ